MDGKKRSTNREIEVQVTPGVFLNQISPQISEDMAYSKKFEVIDSMVEEKEAEQVQEDSFKHKETLERDYNKETLEPWPGYLETIEKTDTIKTELLQDLLAQQAEKTPISTLVRDEEPNTISDSRVVKSIP